MTTVSKQLLLDQWKTLHNTHESYEKYALVIKLVAIVASMTTFIFSVHIVATLLLLAIFWLQEGIWKTFQSRAAGAIITIENRLAYTFTATDIDIDAVIGEVNESTQPYLVYTDWQKKRSSTIGLINEYIKNSLKPTVVYPYVPLMLIILAIKMI